MCGCCPFMPLFPLPMWGDLVSLCFCPLWGKAIDVVCCALSVKYARAIVFMRSIYDPYNGLYIGFLSCCCFWRKRVSGTSGCYKLGVKTVSRVYFFAVLNSCAITYIFFVWLIFFCRIRLSVYWRVLECLRFCLTFSRFLLLVGWSTVFLRKWRRRRANIICVSLTAVLWARKRPTYGREPFELLENSGFTQ